MNAGTASLDRNPWESERRVWILGDPRAETGGAVLLVAAALTATVWANAAPASYESVWSTHLSIALGPHELGTDLRGWINEGLMAVFFLVVGLEAKRELDIGELRERQRLAIPVFAAVGGMVLAGTTFVVINLGGEGMSGWGAAISTDTALALGALALISRGRAMRLRTFLLALVVVDDLVSLAVIAFAYSEHVSLPVLGVAAGLFAALYALRWAGGWRGPAALLVGIAIWLAMFESGVEAVVAGLLIGLVTAAYPPPRADLERSTQLTRRFREQPTPELAYLASTSLTATISPNERLQYRLQPWTMRVIVPLFALANAGIQVTGGVLTQAVTSPVTLGLVAAFVLGKPAGVIAGAWLGRYTRAGGRRLTITWPALITGAFTTGVGFTVSLLIATLAFDGTPMLEEAKVGILGAVCLSILLSLAAATVVRRLPETTRVRQLSKVAAAIDDLHDVVDSDRDHIRGRPDAPVTLVEYGDFQCAYCADVEPTVRALLDLHAGDVRHVWRHLPLVDVHPDAQNAAEAAEAAAAQDRFWEMHDRLLRHQDQLRPEDLFRHAGAVGLDLDRFSADVGGRRFEQRIFEDVETADASGVAGTPTFFINRRRYRGPYALPALSAAIGAALGPQHRNEGART